MGTSKDLSLSELLKLHRSRARVPLSQKEFALRLEVSSRALRDWESEVNFPSLFNLKKIIEVFLQLELFAPGKEQAEAQRLWNTRRESETVISFPPFDQIWFEGLAKHSPLASNPIEITPLSLPSHNLPADFPSFIGRGKEIAEVKHLLETARLVTLTGTGGVGKSRLAARLGWELLQQFQDGVWLVELAPLNNPELIPQVLASSLEIKGLTGPATATTLLNFLKEKVLLLVLDNCEHLIAGCAILVNNLLKACPRLKILATSREGLNLPGEVLWRVSSLTLPPNAPDIDLQTLFQSEAVQLFMERATAAKPNFALNRTNSRAVIQICQRLDGIPLALELAAARVKVLTVEQISARLDDRFRLLTSGNRATLPRQQTLVALIDWSYTLLTETEQRLFRRLSVLSGSWSLEAAIIIGVGNGVEVSDILDTLSQLINKSLVIIDDSAVQREQTLYYLLETIRQYGQEKLLESGEVEAWEKVVAYLDQLGNQAKDSFNFGAARLFFSEELEAITHLSQTPDNKRQWVDAAIKLTIGYLGGANPYYLISLLSKAESFMPNISEEGLSEIDQLRLDLVRYRLGTCYSMTGDSHFALKYTYQVLANSAVKLREETLTVASTLSMKEFLVLKGEPALPLYARYSIGELLSARMQYKEAISYLEQAASDFARLGRWNMWCAATANLSVILAITGHYQSAVTLGQDSLKLILEIGDRNLAAPIYYNWGLVYYYGFNLELALENIRKAIEIAQKEGNEIYCYIGFSLQGLIQSKLDKPFEARQSIAKAREIQESFGEQLAQFEWFKIHQAEVAYHCGEYGEASQLVDEALEQAKKIENWSINGTAELLRGQILTSIGVGNLKQATIHMQTALATFEKVGASILVGQTHEAWGDLDYKAGDLAQALEHFNLATKIFQEAGLEWGVAKIQRVIAELIVK